MGNGASKEEQLYHAVHNGNSNAVKALRHDGASLEFVDKEGRTPLIIACTRGELCDMVLTLLNLGANIRAYQPGSHGGTPLHQAAKYGLDRTVFFLLSRGADPLAVNDDVLTPLDLARNRGHLSVVRMIEDRIALFTGMLREMSGLGILETFAPHWVTKKIWAAVVPTESDPRKPPRRELVIYLSQTNPLPRTLIPLARAEVEEPKFSLPDPILVVTDKSTRTKYKFLAEAPGDKAQIERLYKACKGVDQVPAGMPPQTLLQGLSAMIRPAAQQHHPPPEPLPSSSGGPNPGKLKYPVDSASSSDAALQMAMDASLRTAVEGVHLNEDKRHDTKSKPETSKLGGWGDDGDGKEPGLDFNGWGMSAEAGPSSSSRPSRKAPEPEREETSVPSTSLPSMPSTPSVPPLAPSVPPSAPPLPAEALDQEGGVIYYPPIDTSPVEIDYSAMAQPAESSASAPKASEEKSGQCVVCWDAPAQAVCIPCGHLAGCMDCLSEIKAKDWGCPVCRAPIQQVIKVYAV